MVATVLKTLFLDLKSFFYRDYKKFDGEAFKRKLQEKRTGQIYACNRLEQKFLEILNINTPIKKYEYTQG